MLERIERRRAELADLIEYKAQSLRQNKLKRLLMVFDEISLVH